MRARRTFFEITRAVPPRDENFCPTNLPRQSELQTNARRQGSDSGTNARAVSPPTIDQWMPTNGSRFSQPNSASTHSPRPISMRCLTSPVSPRTHQSVWPHHSRASSSEKRESAPPRQRRLPTRSPPADINTGRNECFINLSRRRTLRVVEQGVGGHCLMLGRSVQFVGRPHSSEPCRPQSPHEVSRSYWFCS